jgi:hypothetical protein
VEKGKKKEGGGWKERGDGGKERTRGGIEGHLIVTEGEGRRQGGRRGASFCPIRSYLLLRTTCHSPTHQALSYLSSEFPSTLSNRCFPLFFWSPTSLLSLLAIPTRHFDSFFLFLFHHYASSHWPIGSLSSIFELNEKTISARDDRRLINLTRRKGKKKKKKKKKKKRGGTQQLLSAVFPIPRSPPRRLDK